MPKMTAVEAEVRVLEKEGVSVAFGVPGAAINPFYAAMRAHGRIRHVLARYVEGASHMADGYTRAVPGNIGVCLGTSGLAGTDMITGLYAAIADSLPILCVTGQAPRARLHKEDFQAIDIEAIAKPVTKWAVTVREPGLVPRVFQQAFHVMRSGRPGPVLVDLPIDVQTAEIEFDLDTYKRLAKPRGGEGFRDRRACLRDGSGRGARRARQHHRDRRGHALRRCRHDQPAPARAARRRCCRPSIRFESAAPRDHRTAPEGRIWWGGDVDHEDAKIRGRQRNPIPARSGSA